MPAIYTCDICGREDASEDYNGVILCSYHRVEYDLKCLKQSYEEKLQWLKKTHLLELINYKKQIKEKEAWLFDNQLIESSGRKK